MKPRHFLSTSLIACLLATASRAAIYPYAEYHLGEAGSLGDSNKPQDSTGNNHHIPNEAGGGSATVATIGLPPNATGSTACLDTSNTANEGWYGSSNTYSDLPTDNFAFGIFARAAAIGNPTRGDVFTLGDAAGSHKLSLEGNGWSSSVHNVNWIAPAGGVVGSFIPDTWVHLAIVRTGGVSTFYIDGVAHGTFSGDAVHAAPHISVQPGGGEFGFFDGQLDEARIVTFTPGQSTESVLAALQAGVTPTAFVEVGQGATFGSAQLSTDETSVFRLGGTIEDFVTLSQDGGLSVVAGTAPKHLIQISQEGPIPAGSYPLIAYTGTIGGLGFAGLQLAQLPGRISGSLVNNTENSTIDLVITGSESGDITWNGNGTNVWNVEDDSNWVFTGGSTPTKFFPGDLVRFTDTAATNAVTIAETVTPGSIFIPANEDYSFSGAGIGGSATLEKSGTGTLTFTNPNTHTGEIYIDAGTVQVGDGGTTGSLGTGLMLLDGNLIVNRSGTLNMPNSIGGSGNIEKLGDGRLVMSGSSSFTGTVTLTAGVIASGNASCLGSDTGGTTVAAGTTLDVIGGGFGNEPITINGNGVNDEGAIVNTAAGTQLNGVKQLTLGSDSTIGGTGRWDVRGAGSSVAGDFILTKIGSNHISLVDCDVSVRDIVVEGGLLSIEFGTAVDNTNPGTITMNAGTLGFGSFTSPITCSKPVVLDGGAINTTWNSTDGDATVASPIEIAAAIATIGAQGGSTLTLTGTVSGAGSLAKGDNGTVVLSVAPAYAGDTLVPAGTLSLAASGLADGSTIDLGAAAVLNLGFSGTDTVSALFINGIQLSPGVYDASHASGRFTGTGSLTVSTGPAGTPYQLWETSNDIDGAGSAADSDNDGISNGIEFVIGGDPSGPGSDSNALKPTATINATHLVFVYRRADESTAFAPFVQYGSDLSGWNTAVNGTNGVTILEEDDAIATGIDRVTVSIPLPANGQSLFARLQTTTF